jgi:tetratricopeptide (TPR) repeat protein
MLGALLLLTHPAIGSAQSAPTDPPSTVRLVERMLNDNRTEEALRTSKALVDQQLATLPVSDPQVADLQCWLGSVYLRLGHLQEAMQATALGLQHREAHLSSYALPLGDAHMQIAKIFLEAGEASKAEDHLRRAARVYADAGAAGQAKAIHVQEQQAGLCLMVGRLSEAERRYDTVLTAQTALLGNLHPDLAQTLNNLGGVYLAEGRTERAMGAYEQALQLQTNAYGADAPALATTCTNLGVLHDQIANDVQAEAYLLRAYAIRTQKLPLYDPLILVSLDNLVSYYLKREAYAKAEALLTEALQRRERTLGADQPAVAEIFDRFATMEMAMNQAALAEQYWLKALQIRENSLGPQSEQVAANLYNLGKLENILGKNDQARIHLNWASDIYENQSIGNEAQITAILSELFMCDYMQGKMEAAEDDLELMYTIKSEIFGPGHPETLSVMEEQVKFYKGIGWDWKAEAVEAEMLKQRTQR